MESVIDLCGLQLTHPIMNAAGTCKTLDDVQDLANSRVAAIVVGSATVEERSGNEGVTYYFDEERTASLNSIGLSNPGIEKYVRVLQRMKEIAHQAGKKLILSASGFDEEDFVVLTYAAQRFEVDLLEINIACPNVSKDPKKKERQSRIMCFDLKFLRKLFKRIPQGAGPVKIPVSVKISPISDPYYLEELATFLNGIPWVTAVTAVNTFPNAYLSDPYGKAVISPFGGLAGLAGAGLKPIALGHVQMLRRWAPDKQIIGVGGIWNQQDVVDFLQAGATAVQVNTAYQEKGKAIFDELTVGL